MDIFKLPSSISWCESNYVNSEYIAEYWNTLTGICLSISGIVFYMNNRSLFSDLKPNFTRITLLLVFVGIGTMLFHGTLYYPFQLLDELPMLMLANEYLILLISLETTQKCISEQSIVHFRNILVYSYSFIPFIIYSYFLHPTLQIICFHITLKVSEISVIFILYRLSHSLNQLVYSKIYTNQEKMKVDRAKNRMSNSLYYLKNENRRTESALLHIVQNDIKTYIQLRRLLTKTIKVGLYVYSCSISIWCIENMFCKYIQPLQLHAFWHILSSVGIYYLNTIMKIHNMIDRFAR